METCIICEKEYECIDITQYKFKKICRCCINFFKNTIIFYNYRDADKYESDYVGYDYKIDKVIKK